MQPVITKAAPEIEKIQGLVPIIDHVIINTSPGPPLPNPTPQRTSKTQHLLNHRATTQLASYSPTRALLRSFEGGTVSTAVTCEHRRLELTENETASAARSRAISWNTKWTMHHVHVKSALDSSSRKIALEILLTEASGIAARLHDFLDDVLIDRSAR